ncbi:hypothetical protein CE11_00684 [Megavirus courdo11]|uniref:Uncharacterized protein n=1 Tax=Megavirus courdo11 TaxID=1128140 RepID=K7Y9M8_9VIRU|nr:hypothetical protein CE11_00684 [Megavirus courdo11]
MDPNYNEDLNRQMMALQPAQPVQPAQTSGGFMDFIKNNKLTVLIIVLIIAALIWWFCFRKPKDVAAVNGAVFTPGSNAKIGITKTRALY